MTEPAFQWIMRRMTGGWSRARWVPVVALLAGLLISRAALATGGGGLEARLLAFAGAAQRYAVFAEHGSGDSSIDHVRVYAVDTESSEFRRLWSYVWQATEAEPELTDASLYQRFVKSLAPANAARLAPRGPLVGKSAGLPPKTTPDGGQRPVWTVKGRTLEVALKQLHTFQAMGKFERSDGDDLGFECNGSPPCSTCKMAKVWEDGEAKEIWQCRNARGVRVADGERMACNCHSLGVALALEVRDAALSRSVVGSKVLVVPYELNGSFRAGPRDPVPTLALSYDGSDVTVSAQVSASGTFVVYGFAVNEPNAQATHYPVVAIYRIPSEKSANTGTRNGLATGGQGTKEPRP
jgi:hypothetical protein